MLQYLFLLFQGLTPMFHNKNPPVCVTVLHKELNVFAGMAMEAFCTGLLCLVVCGVLDKRNAHNTDSTAIKIGLTVSSLALVEVSLHQDGPIIDTYQLTHYWLGSCHGSPLFCDLLSALRSVFPEVLRIALINFSDTKFILLRSQTQMFLNNYLQQKSMEPEHFSV